MKRKIFYISIFVIFIAIGVVFYFYKTPAPELGSAGAKCPEDYTENDAGTAEYKETLTTWTSDFFETHSDATFSDWLEAKSQLWENNNCTVAIERSKMSGEVADLKPWERVDYAVQNIIQNAIETPLYVSELGFSFNYPKDMFVMRDPDASRVIVIPNSYNTDKNQTMTAVVISATLNDPPVTPLEWLKGPDSGADMSKGYKILNIDGQKAILMNGGAWIVVNTPDNKRQLSIATLPSVNPSQLLLSEMGIIVDSFVFSK